MTRQQGLSGARPAAVVVARRERWWRGYAFRSQADAFAFLGDSDKHGNLCMAEGARESAEAAALAAARTAGLADRMPPAPIYWPGSQP